MDILHAMHDAKFVQVNGEMFVNAYSCDPEDTLVDDDIVLEIASKDSHADFTFDDVRDAEKIGPVAYRLRSGAVLYFLSLPTVH